MPEKKESAETAVQTIRRVTDRNGPLYVIQVTIHDVAGNAAQMQTFVVVPHDQR